MSDPTNRPLSLYEPEPFTPENVFAWLDSARRIGEFNMFGAAPYVADAFEVELPPARAMVMAWMKTFNPDLTVAERVEQAAELLEMRGER